MKEKNPSIKRDAGFFSPRGEFKTTICERFSSRDPRDHTQALSREVSTCHLMFPAWGGVHSNDIVFIKYCFNINKP
ncbi:hypothetical protein QQF64_019383 [Cirrhinus molitorella]|uniref:Uncharacterized protein n=1 Tax=Cirrhinus molitorella TaxID=172907 RepID=A0ABR3LFA9_9TELE